MKVLQVGIIGYGLSGRLFHGGVIQGMKEFMVRSIMTKDPIKQKQAIEDFGQINMVKSPEDIFEDEKIDLVLICTPNSEHAPLASKAMAAGKHVILEKPFTITSTEGKALVDEADKANKILSVYHNRRFDSDFLTVKKIIASGQLGRLVAYESHFDRFRNEFKVNSWREEGIPGSGILYDLGPHLIDQALDLFGMPVEVYGDIGFQRRGKTDDQFEIILYYPEFKVTLKSSMLVKEPLPRFIIQGTNGTFLKYGIDVQEAALRSGKRPYESSWGLEPEEIWGILNTMDQRVTVESERGDYRYYYQNIYEAIVLGKALQVTKEDGLRVIQIIEAVIKSHEEKRRIPIKKP